jgi:hypothetical protein
MFVVVQDDHKIINVLFENDVDKIEEYITKILKDKIKRLCIEDVSSIYTIKSNEREFQIIKEFTKVKKGYVYNSHSQVSEVVVGIKYYSDEGCDMLMNADNCGSNLTNDLNGEINKRVLRQLDKDSLYQVFVRVMNCIKTKDSFTKHEFTMIISEIVHNFKKDLYSTIAKRMRRYGSKKQTKSE